MKATVKYDLLGIFLAAVTGIFLFAMVVIRSLLPQVILPRFNGMTLIALCLASLVLHHYLTHERKRAWLPLPLYGALIFGLFPLASGFVAPMDSLQLALMGALIATVVTLLYDLIIDRLSTGPTAKLAPLISAFGLFLAAQCLMGII